MKITLTRTGGFTGIPIKKTIDTDSLPPEEKEKVEELVQAVKPHPNPLTTRALRSGNGRLTGEGEKAEKISRADQFSYTISVEDGEIAQNITLQESHMSKEMKKIVDMLQRV